MSKKKKNRILKNVMYEKGIFSVFNKLNKEEEYSSLVDLIESEEGVLTLYLRHLNAFKKAFLLALGELGYTCVFIDVEELENKQFQVLDNPKETYMINIKKDDKNEIKVVNFDTCFLKVKRDLTIEEIVEYEKEANERGFSGISASSASKNKWKKDFEGGRMTKGIFNISDWNEEQLIFNDNILKGGLNLIGHGCLGEKISNTISVDINSHYPSIALEYSLPYGKPVVLYNDSEVDYYECIKNGTKNPFINDKENISYASFKGNKEKAIYEMNFEDLSESTFVNNREIYKDLIKCKIFAFKVFISEATIKDNRVPWVSVKNEKDEIIYPHKINKEIMFLYQREFERLLEDYDVKTYSIMTFYGFRAKKYMFKEYLDYLKEWKETSEKGSISRNLAKMYFNSFLGSFASKRIRKNNIYDEKGIIRDVKYVEFDDCYRPLFAYITSLGRVIMAGWINDVVTAKYFVYCDTDSITFKDDGIIIKYLPLDSRKLGYFDLESYNESIYIKKQKYYAKETIYGELKYIVAGLNTDNLSVTIDEFIEGGFFYDEILTFDNKGYVDYAITRLKF